MTSSKYKVLHHHRPIFHRPFQKSASRSAKTVDSPVPCAKIHLVADILCSVVKEWSCLFCVQLFIAAQVSLGESEHRVHKCWIGKHLFCFKGSVVWKHCQRLKNIDANFPAAVSQGQRYSVACISGFEMRDHSPRGRAAQDKGFMR